MSPSISDPHWKTYRKRAHLSQIRRTTGPTELVDQPAALDRSRTTADYSVHLTQAAALDAFVYKMESVAASEIAEWRSQHANKSGSATTGGDELGPSRPTQVNPQKSATAA